MRLLAFFLLTSVIVIILLHFSGCSSSPDRSTIDNNPTPNFDSNKAKEMVAKINNQFKGKILKRTGFIIGTAQDGMTYILTAPHKDLLKDDKKITVTLPGKPTVNAHIVGDPSQTNDIAILVTNTRLLPTKVPYYFAIEKEKTDKGVIVGYKVGEDSSNHYRVTLSGVSDKITLTGFGSGDPKGLSGSPVFLEDSGKIIGMVTEDDEGNLGAVPIGIIRDYLNTPDGRDVLKQQDNRKIPEPPKPEPESPEPEPELESPEPEPPEPEPEPPKQCPTSIQLILKEDVLDTNGPFAYDLSIEKKCAITSKQRYQLSSEFNKEGVLSRDRDDAEVRIKKYEQFYRDFCE